VAAGIHVKFDHLARIRFLSVKPTNVSGFGGSGAGCEAGAVLIVEAGKRGGANFRCWKFCWKNRRFRDIKKPLTIEDKRFLKLVARTGIEPVTQGFSILCSTN
jgi:hypothetical protein